MGFVNTIITHITNGNKNEERLVNIMGGTVIETESEKLIRKGEEIGEVRGAKATISILLDLDYSSDKIVETMQNKMGITKAQAEEYMKRYQENKL
jgi:5S rRNA maturation endonuclease (ribonuclease M5)